jgi:subtilisin family serine protease
MQIEKFEASELIPGLRLARVAESETMNAVAALRAQPDVLFAEPNYILRAAVNPNDPHFGAGRQSNMTQIGAPQAWNTTPGSTSVVVGILDQGVQISHADLAANIWTNPSPGSLPPITGDLHGYNFVNDNGDVTDGPDDEVHGTHVAGIIGAVGNNSRGVAGVNWSVGLMPLKFLDPLGEGELSDLLDACAYAKQMRDLWVSSGHTKGANIRVLNAALEMRLLVKRCWPLLTLSTTREFSLWPRRKHH